MAAQCVRVSVRIRPLLGEACNHAWVKRGDGLIGECDSEQAQRFESVLAPEDTNATAFSRVASEAVDRAVDGWNSTIFMYGQTGSGKTHTMTGNGNDPGIIPRAGSRIFDRIDALTDARRFLVRASYLEIYNEKIYDLLDGRKELKSRFDVENDRFFCHGLKETIAKNARELNAVRLRGEVAKRMGVSNLNEHSSRSHCIFCVVIESADKDPAADSGESKEDAGLVRVARLNLVDLAGSETYSRNQVSTQQRETIAINKSLTALKDVIIALSTSTNKKRTSAASTAAAAAATATTTERRRRRPSQHVPFRNSELTKLLKSSLGGNSLTHIVITITPAEAQRRESRMTIDFGTIAKKVENLPKQNETSNDKDVLLRRYEQQIAALQSKLAAVSELERQKAEAEAEVARLRDLGEVVIETTNDEETERRIRDLEAALRSQADTTEAMENELSAERQLRAEAMELGCNRDEFVAETMSRLDAEAAELRRLLRAQFDKDQAELSQAMVAEREQVEREREQVLQLQREAQAAWVQIERQRGELREQMETVAKAAAAAAAAAARTETAAGTGAGAGAGRGMSQEEEGRGESAFAQDGSAGADVDFLVEEIKRLQSEVQNLQRGTEVERLRRELRHAAKKVVESEQRAGHADVMLEELQSQVLALTLQLSEREHAALGEPAAVSRMHALVRSAPDDV